MYLFFRIFKKSLKLKSFSEKYINLAIDFPVNEAGVSLNCPGVVFNVWLITIGLDKLPHIQFCPCAWIGTDWEMLNFLNFSLREIDSSPI